MLKGIFKQIYYFILGPLHRRVTVEREAATLAQVEQLSQEVDRLTKRDRQLTHRVNRFKERIVHMEDEIRQFKVLAMEHESRVTLNIQDEFVKMYALLDYQTEHAESQVKQFKTLAIEHENRMTAQIQAEFVKMYELIDSIRADREDVKLNSVLVNELIKIHQSIESMKSESRYELNGKN